MDIFSHYFVVKFYIVCLKKTKYKLKRGRGLLIFLKEIADGLILGNHGVLDEHGALCLLVDGDEQHYRPKLQAVVFVM